jgi:hypothetical protein
MEGYLVRVVVGVVGVVGQDYTSAFGKFGLLASGNCLEADMCWQSPSLFPLHCY